MFNLKIASLKIEVKGLSLQDVPTNISLFQIAGEEASSADEKEENKCFYSFSWVDVLPVAEKFGLLVYERPNLKVWQKNQLERRLVSVSSEKDAYAVYEEKDATHVVVCFLQSEKENMKIDSVFLSCLALERRFALCGGFILHSAFLAYKGRAILFSGPSGIGKSTHANLWCENVADTHVVNGDRCLLMKNEQGRYEAWGWPVCGSSGICRNEHYPIAAIVFLEQLSRNVLIEDSAINIFKRLYAQITINHWNVQQTSRMVDEIMNLTSTLSISVYGCNMQATAPLPLKEWVDKRILS